MNEKQKRRYLLETENVKTALLRLGIPTMIGMLVSALYNIVDTFFAVSYTHLDVYKRQSQSLRP